MSFMTPDNFNMYISSLKLDQEQDTLYGPQLTQVIQRAELQGRFGNWDMTS